MNKEYGYLFGQSNRSEVRQGKDLIAFEQRGNLGKSCWLWMDKSSSWDVGMDDRLRMMGETSTTWREADCPPQYGPFERHGTFNTYVLPNIAPRKQW